MTGKQCNAEQEETMKCPKDNEELIELVLEPYSTPLGDNKRVWWGCSRCEGVYEPEGNANGNRALNKIPNYKYVDGELVPIRREQDDL
jgi:hypothetical protein